jgi:CRP-like cAMP-binding protein
LERREKTLTLARFLDCGEDSAAILADAMRLANFKARSFLAHQGEDCTCFWLILDGTVQLRAVSFEGQNTVVSSFGPGEVIGAFASSHTFNYDIRALSSLTALEVPGARLAEIVAQNNDIGSGLSRIYAGQLDVVLDRFSSRVSLSAVGRFYKELLRAAEGADTVSPPPVVSAMALIAQTTRETGSRAMSKLERRGIIERHPDHLKIISRGMLEDLVV